MASSSMSLINFNQGTAAVLQGSQQYTVGLFSGALIEWVFTHWKPEPDNVPMRVAKLVAQAGTNGFLLSFLIPWLHPFDVENYRDPTGGYLLAFGIIHGQPLMTRDSKELISSLLEIYEERALGKPDPDAHQAVVTDNE